MAPVKKPDWAPELLFAPAHCNPALQKSMCKIEPNHSGSYIYCFFACKNHVKEIYVESLRALGRKATVIEDIYEKAKQSGTKVVVADLPNAFETRASPAVNFQRRVMAAVQEFERDVIVQRLQEGLRAKAGELRKQGLPEKVNGRKSALEMSMPGKRKTARLKNLCRQRAKGVFGWRTLAEKVSIVLGKGAPLKKGAAMTMSAQLLA